MSIFSAITKDWKVFSVWFTLSDFRAFILVINTNFID